MISFPYYYYYSYLTQVGLKFDLVVMGVEKNYPNNEYKMAEFNYQQSGMLSDKVSLSSGSASLTFSYNVSIYRRSDLLIIIIINYSLLNDCLNTLMYNQSCKL